MEESKSLAALTPRQRAVAQAVAEGLANKEIGARLGITENTVKAYLSRIFETLGISGRLRLALLVIAEAR